MSDECINTGEVELCRAIKTLWYWRKGGTSFSCMLLDLAHRCKSNKRELLFRGFPYLRMAYRQWSDRKNTEIEFFAGHELEFKG